MTTKKKPAKVVKPIGRPSSFTQAVADGICERLAGGESLRSICAGDKMPRMATVFRWLADDRYKLFREQYARAREEQAEKMADEIVDIADEAAEPLIIDGAPIQVDGKPVMVTTKVAVDHARLKIDARKWVASKLKPKKYGEKVAIGGADDLPPMKIQSAAELTDEQLAAIALKTNATQP